MSKRSSRPWWYIYTRKIIKGKVSLPWRRHETLVSKVQRQQDVYTCIYQALPEDIQGTARVKVARQIEKSVKSRFSSDLLRKAYRIPWQESVAAWTMYVLATIGAIALMFYVFTVFIHF